MEMNEIGGLKNTCVLSEYMGRMICMIRPSHREIRDWLHVTHHHDTKKYNMIDKGHQKNMNLNNIWLPSSTAGTLGAERLTVFFRPQETKVITLPKTNSQSL